MMMMQHPVALGVQEPPYPSLVGTADNNYNDEDVAQRWYNGHDDDDDMMNITMMMAMKFMMMLIMIMMSMIFKVYDEDDDYNEINYDVDDDHDEHDVYGFWWGWGLWGRVYPLMMNLVSGQYAQVATGFDQLHGPTPVPEPGPGGVRVVADLQPHLPADRGVL